MCSYKVLLSKKLYNKNFISVIAKKSLIFEAIQPFINNIIKFNKLDRHTPFSRSR